ncbi:MAG: hypothetical protein LBR86_02550 [Tannerella sp.]|jgi:hypothetical protein|nr:hypothetical protein [Tannerella sp.]
MKRCIFVSILAGVVLSVFAQFRALPDSTVRSQKWTLTLEEVEVSVQKRNQSSLEVPVAVNALSGTGSVRSFTLPAYKVTVAATFYKSPTQTDREAVDATKASIEGGTYRIAQATGNTESDPILKISDGSDRLFVRNMSE